MFLIILLLSSLVTTIGLAESRQKIAVIDTGVNLDSNLSKYICDNGLYDITNSDHNDYIGHGTNIIGIISNKLDNTKYCIVSIKFINNVTENKNSLYSYVKALKLAIGLKPAYLNLSLSGTSYTLDERHYLRLGLDGGTKIAVSAGNDAINLDFHCIIFPACHRIVINNNSFRVIGSKNNGKISHYSNRGLIVTDWLNGDNVCYKNKCFTGTSQATAQFTNKWVRGLVK